MIKGNQLLGKVYCKYGAPMGRQNCVDKSCLPRYVNFFRVVLEDGYDTGGAYWGEGQLPLYAAIGYGFEMFIRSSSLLKAMGEFCDEFPDMCLKWNHPNDDFMFGYCSAVAFVNDFPSMSFTPRALEIIATDCIRFLRESADVFHEDSYRNLLYLPYEELGGLFFLDRQQTGAGYMDSNLPHKEKLSEIAKGFSPTNFFVNSEDEIDV